MDAAERETWTVGHDGSSGASHAVGWAIAHARGRDVELRLVRSWYIRDLDAALAGGSVEQFAPRAVCDDLDIIVSDAERAGSVVSSRVIHGSPSNVLLDESAESELLVVGSRGMGGFRRLLLGSVSSQCAAHARVPTIVVPASSSLAAPLRRVVVGMDGSERSQRALRWASEFVPVACEITVAGAWMPSRSGFLAVAQHYTDELEQARSRFHEIVDEIERDLGDRRFERHFVFKDPSQMLMELDPDADLLLVGRRGHSSISAVVLGSVATHVIHHSHVPVAVVPVGD